MKVKWETGYAIELTTLIPADHKACSGEPHFISIGLDGFSCSIQNWQDYLKVHPPFLIAWGFVRYQSDGAVTKEGVELENLRMSNHYYWSRTTSVLLARILETEDNMVDEVMDEGVDGDVDVLREIRLRFRHKRLMIERQVWKNGQGGKPVRNSI
jgi:hypothetical protein